MCVLPHLVDRRNVGLRADLVSYNCLGRGLGHGYGDGLGHGLGHDPDAGADGGSDKHAECRGQESIFSRLDFVTGIVCDGFSHPHDDSDHNRSLPFDFALMRNMSCLQVMVSECPRAEPSAGAVDG